MEVFSCYFHLLFTDRRIDECEKLSQGQRRFNLLGRISRIVRVRADFCIMGQGWVII